MKQSSKWHILYTRNKIVYMYIYTYTYKQYCFIFYNIVSDLTGISFGTDGQTDIRTNEIKNIYVCISYIYRVFRMPDFFFIFFSFFCIASTEMPFHHTVRVYMYFIAYNHRGGKECKLDTRQFHKEIQGVH